MIYIYALKSNTHKKQKLYILDSDLVLANANNNYLRLKIVLCVYGIFNLNCFIPNF